MALLLVYEFSRQCRLVVVPAEKAHAAHLVDQQAVVRNLHFNVILGEAVHLVVFPGLFE